MEATRTGYIWMVALMKGLGAMRGKKIKKLNAVRRSIAQEFLGMVVTPRQALQFTLFCDNESTPKIGPAKRALAEELISRGFGEKDLAECSEVPASGQRFADDVECFLNGLQNDMEKARWFVDLAYSQGWIDDAAVHAWFMRLSKA